MAPDPAGRLRAAGAFATAARGYWLAVHPLIRSELAHWRVRASAIDDPALRSLALHALAKRGNMEGAAAFATFVPRQRRDAVVRATVAFQAAYNHLDLLSEQPYDGDAVAHSADLHDALSSMLTGEPYTHALGDGGYLGEIARAFRQATAQLPGYGMVAERALRAAQRVARFQSFNCGARQGDHDGLARWAATLLPEATPMTWWEAAGAAGSSLGVHVMLAAAAKPHSKEDLLQEIEDAYFPWACALHSILDQLVDTAEDERTGQANLTSYYLPSEQAGRIGWLTEEAIDRVHALDLAAGHERGGLHARHALILIGMASMYLAAPQAQRQPARQAAQAVLDRLGPLAIPSIAIFRLRGRAGGGSPQLDSTPFERRDPPLRHGARREPEQDAPTLA